MSDLPFSPDQGHGPPVDETGLLERLKARQQSVVSSWVKEKMRSRKPGSQPGEPAEVALTTQSTRQLLQRVRGRGQQTRTWRPDIGSLTPGTFRKLPVEVSQRLHRIRPLGLRGMRRGAAPSAAQSSEDLILPTGRSEPASQIGPGSPIPTLSAGMVIPPMAPPSFARREAEAGDQAKMTQRPAPAEPRSLPPRARLYSRVEEYQPGKLESAVEPTPGEAQPGTTPSLSAPPAQPPSGVTADSQASTQPPAVQRTPEPEISDQPGQKKPEAKLPSAQQRAKHKKPPQTVTKPSGQPPVVQRTPAFQELSQPEAPVEAKTTQEIKPPVGKTEAIEQGDLTGQPGQPAPATSPGEPQKPAGEGSHEDLPLYDNRLPSSRQGETGLPPVEKSAEVQPQNIHRPAGQPEREEPATQVSRREEALPGPTPAALETASQAQAPQSTIPATPAPPRESRPAQPGRPATALPKARPAPDRPTPRLARARALPLQKLHRSIVPGTRALAKALPRPAPPSEPTTAIKPTLSRVTIQRAPAPAHRPAVEPRRGEPGITRLTAVDRSPPDVQPAVAVPPGTGPRPAHPATFDQPAIKGISSARPAPVKESQSQVDAARPASSKSMPLRTAPLSTAQAQPGQEPVIQRQPEGQPAVTSMPVQRQFETPQKVVEDNRAREATLPEALTSPPGTQPAVSYIVQRAARRKALAESAQAKKIAPQTLRRPLMPRAMTLDHGRPAEPLPDGKESAASPTAQMAATGTGDFSQAIAGLPAIFKIPPSNTDVEGMPLPVPGMMHIPEKLRQLLQAAEPGPRKSEPVRSAAPSSPPAAAYQPQPELPLRQLPPQADAERAQDTGKDQPAAVQPMPGSARQSGKPELIQRVETESATTDVAPEEPQQIDYRDLAQRVLPHLKKLITIEGERGIHLRR